MSPLPSAGEAAAAAPAIATTGSTVSRPALVLAALFSLSALLLGVIKVPIEGDPRWPNANSVYAVNGWSVSAESVDLGRPGVAMVSRGYSRPDGTRATLVVTTSTNAKTIFRAGAAVPFLGNGYSVEPASMVPASGAREAFIARRGNEAWLQISIYGERRGQFGSGFVGWTFSTIDSLLGRDNDYYLVRLVAPYDEERAPELVALADALFPRLADFYRN